MSNPSTDKRGASLLVLDDEVEIVDTLERLCLLRGIKCVKSTNPKYAIELHRKMAFPVVLTDIKMPDIDGIGVTRAIKAAHPMTQVYIMTGYATLMNLADCLGAGAADFFFKPFENIDQIGDTVQEAFARHTRWVKHILLKDHRDRAA